jgi:hypothetical protein
MKDNFLFSVNNHITFEEMKKILMEIDNWATYNYLLLIGIDKFSIFIDISNIDLLSLVRSTTNLKYIFYYCGIKKSEFLDNLKQIISMRKNAQKLSTGRF